MQYRPKAVVPVRAHRVTDDTGQDHLIGITRVMKDPTKFYTDGLSRRKYGRLGDWVVWWPDDRVEVYTDRAFRAMFDPLPKPGRHLTNQEIADAYHRSGLDISPCSACGQPIIVIPDGMPGVCSECEEEGRKP